MYRILHLLLLLLFLDSKSFLVEGAECTEALEMPDKSEDNRDTSGLRPNKLPPIAIGDTVTYQCPGMKSIKRAKVALLSSATIYNSMCSLRTSLRGESANAMVI